MSLLEMIFQELEKTDGNSEAVADMLSNDLNAAVQQYKEKIQKNQKQKDAEALAEHFNAFIKVWYPTTQSELNGSEIVEILDFTEKLLNPEASIDDVIAGIFNAANPLKDVKPKNLPTKTVNKKKTLSDMIAEMGW